MCWYHGLHIIKNGIIFRVILHVIVVSCFHYSRLRELGFEIGRAHV